MEIQVPSLDTTDPGPHSSIELLANEKLDIPKEIKLKKIKLVIFS